MPNPFGKNGGPVNSVPRNTFDLSFQTNGTYQFGGLYPVLCKEVIPGDSFKIDTTFGLRFMPTAFPLQTRMRADIHFFYVRNRNLWKDWPDFYGKTKQNLSFPVIKQTKEFYRTGSLSDHLGLPTSIYGSETNSSAISTLTSTYDKYCSYSLLGSTLGLTTASRETVVGSRLTGDVVLSPTGFTSGSPCLRVGFNVMTLSKGTSIVVNFEAYKPQSEEPFVCYFYNNSVCVGYSVGSVQSISNVETGDYYVSFPVSSDIQCQGIFVAYPDVRKYGDSTLAFRDFFSLGSYSPQSYVDYPDSTSSIYSSIYPSALPFRAYESIYNSFYRDERNNPFVIDGEKEFNRYLPTQEGGNDTTPYALRFRNWEQDFLTTAVPTPQQGVAPLVGISAAGVMSISDPDTGQVYQVQAKTADDADTIVGYDVTETLPKAVTRSLVNYASSGISINDFRNVNAYQRWLETNIRRGFKYRDMIKSHFDVDISYQELDMPEFIGGVSIDIMPQTISQTSADSADNPLGSYAGQLYGSGSSKNSISQYFDEHGFVMAILSVVPVPNYSQLTPKHYFKTTDSLDYYSPEFGHIGLQSIQNQEVSLLQCNMDTYNRTFGYQRAWYDYLQSVDEVHGQFRTTLRDFVMNRVFDNLPILGPSFTVIDPKQLNDVFTVREVEGEPIDPILGQIYFDIKAKRPIPRYGVPRLE